MSAAKRGKAAATRTKGAAPASVAALEREMRELLACRVDPAYLEFIATAIGVRDKVMGVRVPAIRAAVKEFQAAHSDADVDDAVALLDRSAARGVREEMLFATFWLARFRRKFHDAIWSHVSDWIEALNNWETCDQLAMNVAAELVAARIALVDELVAWSRAKNLWRRRFALATGAALNQRGRKFPAETLRICEAVVNDPEATIRKAAAWAIREASDLDADAAFAFLWKHRNAAHRTVLREASEKLSKARVRELLE